MIEDGFVATGPGHLAVLVNHELLCMLKCPRVKSDNQSLVKTEWNNTMIPSTMTRLQQNGWKRKNRSSDQYSIEVLWWDLTVFLDCFDTLTAGKSLSPLWCSTFPRTHYTLSHTAVVSTHILLPCWCPSHLNLQLIKTVTTLDRSLLPWKSSNLATLLLTGYFLISDL